MTRKVLLLAALAEGGFGLLLLTSPPIVCQLLFGANVSGLGVTVGRLTGMAIFALAIACWPSSDSRNALYGMLVWSALAMVYLIVIGFTASVGVLLWPAVVVHAAIAMLLLFSWSREQKQEQ